MMSVTPGMGRGTNELSMAEMIGRPARPKWKKKRMRGLGPWWAGAARSIESVLAIRWAGKVMLWV